MKRIAEENLKQWLGSKHRKPLIIRGARQVGKSTIVRNFAKKQKLKFYEINLEKHAYLNKSFQSLNIPQILLELEVILGEKIKPQQGLLFLDELQATPDALAACRYFYEEYPELPLICAGSLLEFTLKDHNYSMPVGRISYMHLGPMSFIEYLQALEQDILIEQIQKHQILKPFPEAAHHKLLKQLKDYFYIGGMPEAISVYKDTKDLSEVESIHSEIIETYKDDFSKYFKTKKDLVLLQEVFNYVGLNAGKKIKYSNINQSEQSKFIKHAIELLNLAKVITSVTHSHASGIPLNAQAKANIYKCFFLDVGLMNHMCGLNWQIIQNLDEKKLINEGAIAEQFIAQHLLYREGPLSKPLLYYWLREGKTGNAEVDFVITEQAQLVGIEVKAGKSGTLRSLKEFVKHSNNSLNIRFDLNSPSHMTFEAQSQLLCLPLYLVSETKRLVHEYLNI